MATVKLIFRTLLKKIGDYPKNPLPSSILRTFNHKMYRCRPKNEVLNNIFNYVYPIPYPSPIGIHGLKYQYEEPHKSTFRPKVFPGGRLALLVKHGIDFVEVSRVWPCLFPMKKDRELTNQKMLPFYHDAGLWESEYAKHTGCQPVSFVQYISTTLDLYEYFTRDVLPNILPPIEGLTSSTEEELAKWNTEHGQIYVIANVFEDREGVAVKGEGKHELSELWIPFHKGKHYNGTFSFVGAENLRRKPLFLF